MHGIATHTGREIEAKDGGGTIPDAGFFSDDGSLDTPRTQVSATPAYVPTPPSALTATPVDQLSKSFVNRDVAISLQVLQTLTKVTLQMEIPRRRKKVEVHNHSIYAYQTNHTTDSLCLVCPAMQDIFMLENGAQGTVTVHHGRGKEIHKVLWLSQSHRFSDPAGVPFLVLCFVRTSDTVSE